MKRRTLPALLLPLALLLSACGGASSADSGGNTDGKGSLTLNVGDQKGVTKRSCGPPESSTTSTTASSGPPSPRDHPCWRP